MSLRLLGFSLVLAVLFSPLVSRAQNFTVSAGQGQVGKNSDSYGAVELNKDYPLNWWAKTESKPMRISFTPKDVFALLPDSEVQVTGTGAANSKFRRLLKLKSGGLDLDLQGIKSTGSKVEVETPTAICGAVGTRFSVNAGSGDFKVTEGSIYAKAGGDNSFEAESVNGSFTLNPGSENAYSKANVSGSFKLNGKSYRANGVSLQIAEAKGGSEAAVQISGGSLGGTGSGRYIMSGGSLEPVDSSKTGTHSEYLAAAQKEGRINVELQSRKAAGSPVGNLPAQLNAAADKATELRKLLFQRKVVRDTAKETARSVQEVTRQRPAGMGH